MSIEVKTAGVIGGGAWGTALAQVAAHAGLDVTLVPGGNGVDSLQMIDSGLAQISIGGSDAVVAAVDKGELATIPVGLVRNAVSGNAWLVFDNGLAATEELGTYRSNLMFVTAGMWAMAIQFRLDSTKVLQKTPDWTQDIMAAEEPGDFSPPSSSRPPEPPPRAKDSTRKEP